jgi:hypothetical protein
MTAVNEFIELYPTYSRTKKKGLPTGSPISFGAQESTSSTLRRPALQHLMRALRIGQRIFLRICHIHFDHAAGDQREQLVAGFLKLFPVGDVALQGRAVTYSEPF